MTISIKEYAAAVGISEAAAYKRMNSAKYSRFLVIDDHGRKTVNTAIFDDTPAIQPLSTDSTTDSTNSTIFSTEVERDSTNLVENSTNHSTDSTVLVENSTTDSTAEVEKLNADSTDSTEDSTKVERNSTTDSTEVETKTAILQLKLEYAQREAARTDQQIDDLRQRINDLRGQLAAKDAQIAELNERLREAHIITHAAQQKPRFFLTGIFDRFRGRKTEGATDAADNQ